MSAFHSPSCVARLPKSRFTCRFLSASLWAQQPGSHRQPPSPPWGSWVGTAQGTRWGGQAPSPRHDLRELHPGQELVILADLAHGAFELALVFVDQPPPLLLLLAAALLPPKLEAARREPASRGGQARAHTAQGAPRPAPPSHSHFDQARREELQRLRLGLLIGQRPQQLPPSLQVGQQALGQLLSGTAQRSRDYPPSFARMVPLLACPSAGSLTWSSRGRLQAARC